MQQLLRASGVVVVVCVLLSALCADFTSATVYELYPTNDTTYWQNVVKNLQAGDVANFHAGTYTYSNDLTAANLQGTSANPIEIRGAEGETRPIWEQTNTGKNIFNVAGTYIMMHDIELVGGSEGIRLGQVPANVPVTHSKFYNLVIHGTQSSGFTANFEPLEYVDLTIEHNEIYDTGSDTSEGFYLGCQSDKCRIRDSLIKDNYVHNNTMATGGSRAGIQVKTGSYNNIIQDNVCWYTKGPCVIVYDDYDRGVNKIIGNLVMNNDDIGIQASAGVEIINNIVFNSGTAGIGVVSNDLKSGSTCRNAVIKHNTIVNITDTGSSSVCMRVTDVTSSGGWVIANNAIYCPGTANCIKAGSSGSVPADDLNGVDVYNNVYFDGAVPDNIRAGGVTLSSGLYADMLDPSPFSLNVYPTSGGGLPGNGAGGSTHSVDYDFNGNSRSSTAPTIGAYEYSTAANPGPALGPGFKGASSPVNPSSGGGGSSGASTFKAMWLKKLGLTDLM